MWWLAGLALAGDLRFTFDDTLDPGQKPEFTITSPTDVSELQIVVNAGSEAFKHEFTGVKAGVPYTFDWARDPSVTEADVHILTTFTDGNEEELAVHVTYGYGGSLSVDLSRAAADVGRRVLVVPVSGRVDDAEIVAYGAHKAELDRRTVRIGAGPGPVEIPWIGDVADVVLLDVKLTSGNAWTTFTYSPWFLDIPHRDVLFASDSAAITAAEEPKLQDTLAQLTDVIEKYGAVVPVQLYIAGCTDTVGNAAHNLDLSRARAKAIAGWLRAHGFDRPIFYHGFGEGLLAVATPDEADNAANRRALYMVGANPPPGSSGVPDVQWTPL